MIGSKQGATKGQHVFNTIIDITSVIIFIFIMVIFIFVIIIAAMSTNSTHASSTFYHPSQPVSYLRTFLSHKPFDPHSIENFPWIPSALFLIAYPISIFFNLL